MALSSCLCFRINLKPVKPKQRQLGFTIVELLVVISILGTMAALLIPAVQAAREAARRNQCLNNLKQLGLAALMHHEAHGHYPSSGWGHKWVGIPGRGTGRKQPGGWIYNILPYIEQQPLHDFGMGQDDSGQRAASATRLQTPVATLVCPSRRPAQTWPTVPDPPPPNPSWPWVRDPKHTDIVYAVARSDYAINGGAQLIFVRDQMPNSLAEGDDPAFNWFDTKIFSGVSFLRSEIRSASVRDGTSNTLMLGEKSLSIECYHSGTDAGDNESMYAGYCTDIVRFTSANLPLNSDPATMKPTDSLKFGSAHAAGFHAVFCDGSAHMINYAIEPTTWEALGSRADGKVIDLLSLQ